MRTGLPGFLKGALRDTVWGQGLRRELGFDALGWTARVDVKLVPVHTPFALSVCVCVHVCVREREGGREEKAGIPSSELIHSCEQSLLR